MLILSVDSTATPASVCLYDGRIIAEFFINTRLTHSQTLASMISSVLDVTGIKPSDIELFAVNSGPGSFTGVRIGVSAVKGMAYALDKPCAAVSTLESMAYNFPLCDAVVCSCMDARRSQVYNALFRVRSGSVERLCPDRAISVDELISELSSYEEKIILAGDGAGLVYASAVGLENVVLAADAQRYQRASSTALAASLLDEIEYTAAASLMPTYLRLSQAEREMKAKKEGNAT